MTLKNFSPKQVKSLSFYALLCSIFFIASIRFSNVSDRETSWDVLGYYLPLPATFIYNDAKLDHVEWVKKVNGEKQLTGTLYQVSTTDDGQPMYFFLFGMALFYLPFFLLGHGWAHLTDLPVDGFSYPYQLALVIGGVVYTLIGLILFRKILLHYFSDKISALAMLTIVFATNYGHHLSFKNLETVNILFMLMCWLIWSVIKWHNEHKFGQMLQIGLAVSLMTLVKPSEIIAVLIPLLWGVNSKSSLIEKIKLVWNYRFQVILVAGIALVLFFPQLLYWHGKTGKFIYDSYKNPGVGLDFTHPHLLEVLFSYRKGWFIYTPVMLLAVPGLFLFSRNNRETGWSFLIYFLVAFYILSSWTEWWYGAAFSCRPVITAYPILALGIAAVYKQLQTSLSKWAVGIYVVLAAFLNNFQWWQLVHGILDPYRTTKEYYWDSFLKTTVPANAEQLKLVYRSFEPGYKWTDQYRYNRIFATELKEEYQESTKDEFTKPVFKKAYGDLTNKDHLWLRIKVDYQTSDTVFTNGPYLVISIMHNDKSYGYIGDDLRLLTDTLNGMYTATYEYMTPEIRIPKDTIITYVWNPGKNNLKINDIHVEAFERKN